MRPSLIPALFLLLSALSLLLYLGASYAEGFLGFPLDDAWIHQGYARNLANRGEFSFVPGQPSAGSTSPLWSGLLALGYLLKVEHRVWTYALGAGLLSVNAWLGYRLALDMWPERKVAALYAGGFVALEWHLAWAAASGMETILFSALALLAFVEGRTLAAEGTRKVSLHAALRGMVVGLSVLARPDGVTLAPFTLGRVALQGYAGGWRRRLAAVLGHLLGYGAIFAPYLAFNQWLGGSVWPNTFYAKQAEYAILREAPFVLRLGQMGGLPLVGAQFLLLPSIAAAAWVWLGQRQWKCLLPMAWVGALVLAYAVRLPATYQHGRYLMPVIPILVAVGVGGLGQLLPLRIWAARRGPPVAGAGVPDQLAIGAKWVREHGLFMRVVGRAWVLAAGVLVLVFWGLGAGAYARDVQIIETEMVATAHWISRNTEPEALIAAHDIGAVGYFGGRRLLDMAGLVSPEVVPFIRDEDRLRTWLDAAGADYLVTFPGWYPALVSAASSPTAGEPRGGKVFQTEAPFSPAAGGENMAVYRWTANLP